jgi:hypothetical protein
MAGPGLSWDPRPTPSRDPGQTSRRSGAFPVPYYPPCWLDFHGIRTGVSWEQLFYECCKFCGLLKLSTGLSWDRLVEITSSFLLSHKSPAGRIDCGAAVW